MELSGTASRSFSFRRGSLHRSLLHSLWTAHRRVYLLKRLKRFGLSTSAVSTCYRGLIENALNDSMTAWYSSCFTSLFWQVVKTAECITGCHLPSLKTIFQTWCLTKAPARPFFSAGIIPEHAQTTRIKNRFFAPSITLGFACMSLFPLFEGFHEMTLSILCTLQISLFESFKPTFRDNT